MDRGARAPGRSRRRAALRLAALGAGAALALAACTHRQSYDPAQWAPEDRVRYRLLTKDDFRAVASGKVWGNVAHGAEICTNIVGVDDDGAPAFRAVMNPKCSLWNSTMGPLATLGGLGAAAVIPGLPTQQPDWYILQHEQIHFAIMEVAARQVSTQLDALPSERRSAAAIESARQAALAHTRERHAQFDAATSGTFDPARLGQWVRALEKEMRTLCGWDSRCWVRHQTPLGWGD